MVLVYIAEAHAADVWPINSSRCAGPANTLVTPTTLEERRRHARMMLDALPALRHVDILVDDIDDAFLETYAAWPIRMYGVHCGALGAVVLPSRATFDLAPMREWILGACGAAEASASKVGRADACGDVALV